MDPSSFLLNRLFVEAYNELKAFLKGKKITLMGNEEFTKETILNHINYISNWSKEVDFKDLNKAKKVSKIYVQLDYLLNLGRDNLVENDSRRIDLDDIFREAENHIVLLGQPGAGKTTTMKYICQSIFYEEKFQPRFQFPILVRLRDLNDDPFSNSQESLFDRLFEILGLKIDSEAQHYPYPSISTRPWVIKMLDALGVLIILDGFDELNPPEKKAKIVKEFEFLCLNLSKAKIVLTSRIGDYNYSIDNTVVYEVSPLTDHQIRLFAKKWLTVPEKYEDLYSQITKSPFYDTAIRPLTMGHLCAIYERYGTIPDKPKNIYKKIVNLLVEEWDLQRMVVRKSSFVNFTPDRKAEFLSLLAFKLTTEVKSSVFSRHEISRVYKTIYTEFSLELHHEKEVLIELEGQTGLFLQSGYDSFEFAHKSLQEYLTADYIVRLQVIHTDKSLVSLLPNEFAIATALSADPSAYFSVLVIKNFAEVNLETIIVFLTRLILENPDFKSDPFLGASILYIRRLHKITHKCDNLIRELINKSPGLRNSLKELNVHYKHVNKEATYKETEIELRIFKTFTKHGIESPFVIHLNSSFLPLLGLKKWS
ncbi:MAG: NACHT domain-containing protein [Imperialibacter sp.]